MSTATAAAGWKPAARLHARRLLRAGPSRAVDYVEHHHYCHCCRRRRRSRHECMFHGSGRLVCSRNNHSDCSNMLVLSNSQAIHEPGSERRQRTCRYLRSSARSLMANALPVLVGLCARYEAPINRSLNQSIHQSVLQSSNHTDRATLIRIVSRTGVHHLIRSMIDHSSVAWH